MVYEVENVFKTMDGPNELTYAAIKAYFSATGFDVRTRKMIW